MTFAWPLLLWLLIVPAALLGTEIARRRRASGQLHPKILHAEAGKRSVDLVARPSAPSRLRPWLCVGLALFIVALARPQWGRIEEPVFDQAREILIAIDLSRSMLSQDVKPTRLDRAKLLTQALLEKLVGERVGLVTFSGTAFLQSPLSSDYEILREFLPALNPDFMPEGGTNYRALIDTSLEAFGNSNSADRFLIILSDGEATDDDWQPRVEELKKRGIRVIGLGVGTATGAMIPDGTGGFVKDDRGAVVLSKLESRTLQQLAQATQGTYRDASSWVDLAEVLKATIEAGRKGKFTEKNTVRLVERFQWPLAFGVWCLFVSFCYEFPVRPKPRELKLRGKIEPENTKPGLENPKSEAAKLATLVVLLVVLRNPSTALAAEPAATAPPPLAKIVGRLAVQDNRTALDWSELARETISWGQQIQSESRPVPPGPVHDALSAVELGRALDPKIADWSKLTQDLEALLKTPESQQQKQPPQDQQNQKQDKQDQKQNQQNQNQQNQQNQQQNQGNEQNQKQQQQSNSHQQSKDGSQQQNQPQSPPKPSSSSQNKAQKPPEKSADQNNSASDDTPSPSSAETQKVGGASEKKPGDDASPPDPSLTVPLQHLEQLRDQDSPAKLFQLMDADKAPPPKKTGKNW